MITSYVQGAMNGARLPSLSFTDVLIDVDGTMTRAREGAARDPRTFVDLLVELLVESRGIDREEAADRIVSAGDPNTTCISSLLPSLGVPPGPYWARVVSHLERQIEFCEDAALLITSLAERGFRLYTATTNSRMAALAKLAVGGLATMEGSPYFTGFFGGDSFGDPKGKFSPDFFPSIIEAADLDPERVLMVGDDPVHDLAQALAAGITQVVLVDRDQKDACVRRTDGGIYVNSLEWVLGELPGDQ